MVNSMTPLPNPRLLSGWPNMCRKELLVFAVKRLADHGDQEAVDFIVANQPPEEKKPPFVGPT